jgi:hypothetical protein
MAHTAESTRGFAAHLVHHLFVRQFGMLGNESKQLGFQGIVLIIRNQGLVLAVIGAVVPIQSLDQLPIFLV